MKTRDSSSWGHGNISRGTLSYPTLLLTILSLGAPPAMAQSSCISLQGSKACPAFNASSISTSTSLKGLFPFLAYVSDVSSFDTQFKQFIATSYSQQKYQQLLGCANVNLTNTTTIYARYTATVLCNSIVQNSAQACGLNDQTARPVCADTCAEFAISEEQIAATAELCGTTAPKALNQIRADFTNCALPANSLTTSCIKGVQNEPENCGFSDNLGSLCSYCAASSPNATDTCCVWSKAESRCQNVHLPLTTSLGEIFTSTATSTPTASAAAIANKGTGLSGGAIAGIVVGSVLGAFLALALIIGCCILARRRKESQRGSVFNQRSSARQAPGPAMSYTSSNRAPPPEILPAGARVHQMAALESTSSSNVIDHSPTAGGGFSSGYDDTPESQRSGLGVAAAPKRGGSLHTLSSPGSHEDYSSPEGLASGQSEQLSHFKDYYSHDDIRPHDTVAVLWAYQPRANDEWELERGDLIKIVGIWDDGWGTGIKMRERADEWEARRNGNRDSGVSNGSRSRPISTEALPDGEIKAFPLVCVCLPQHWRKTIEGDTPDPPGAGSP